MAAGWACTRVAAASPPEGKAKSSTKTKEVEVSPGEDLMREHGVLRRALLVYDEAARRLHGGERVPGASLLAAADLVRRFVEDYHEKIEEQFIFPRFRRGPLGELSALLLRQHEAGRRLTRAVRRVAGGSLETVADRGKLEAALLAFSRMVRPHAAREDTVLFPAYHELLGDKAYDEAGDRFEEIERQSLGEGGFEKAVAEVAKLEAAFGIHDLARFTPA